MGKAWIRLTALDELVLSSRAASAGAHATLDYLPGATLLGAAARRYAEYGTEALAVFHGGAVRFGNARLQVDGAPGLPMPLAWHEAKAGPAAVADGRLQGTAVVNYQHARLEQVRGSRVPIQPRQLRAGYVSAAGGVLRPATITRARTAIEPGQRFAAESQLFSYESLLPGAENVFLAPLEWDDSLSVGAQRRLRESFDGQTISVGRSRSAEYGRVRAEWLGEAEYEADRIAATDGAREVTLWLLADLAVDDERGAPTLAPAPELLGLPPGRLDAERSFVRHREYSPYNAHYRTFESERTVLAQGSVLHFALDAPWGEAHRRRCEAGLGLYREAGLGRVAVNSPLLATAQPRFTSAPGATSVSRVAVAATHPVVEQLRQRRAESGEAAQVQALRVAEEYGRLLETGRRFLGLGAGAALGPRAAQWAEVAQKARDATDVKVLRRELFARAEPGGKGGGRGREGFCMRQRAGWNVECRPDETIGVWLERRWQEGSGATPDRLLLHYIAHAIRARVQREETT